MDADQPSPGRSSHEHSQHSSAPASAASDALDSLLSLSTQPQPPSAMPPSDPACCCGRDECAYLKHNNLALEGLERNVQTAAQLGQALLVRHEAYMVDAEHERIKLNATIEQLETDKRDMEATNAKTVEENRQLLDQLEDLNNAVADSDGHIKSLTATLESTQLELHRLSSLASRTERLEQQLAELEQERADLQHHLARTEEEERTALQRWRHAERTLADLHDQMERIEYEAEEERARHVEVVSRLQQRQAVEKELENAAGRLKGAAATVSRGKDGSGVVSHFVKDILRDNGNLQLGIVELREMLAHSHEEVQQLREQLMLHQPVSPSKTNGVPPRPTLREELAQAPPPPNISQELHVHHHYHASERGKEKAPLRRSKKRRNILPPMTPSSSGTQTPIGPSDPHYRPTPLSPITTCVPNASAAAPMNRWSAQSSHSQSSGPSSSVPSSPQSTSRQPSIFDRAVNETSIDSSRPTSPESSELSSPLFVPQHKARGSDASFRSFTAPTPLQLKSPAPLPPISSLPPSVEEADESELAGLSDLETSPQYPTADVARTSRAPKLHHYQSAVDLRRTGSHESLVSVSGMDIHTLRERPSQLSFVGNGFVGQGTRSVSMPQSATLASSKPTLSATTATARPSLTERRYDSRSYNQTLLQSIDAPPTGSADSTAESIGKRVGGWVWSRWGGSGSASTITATTVLDDPHFETTHTTPRDATPLPNTPRTIPTPSSPPPAAPFWMRSPGVNQPGPIRGLRPSLRKPPSRVQVAVLDEELLAEALRE